MMWSAATRPTTASEGGAKTGMTRDGIGFADLGFEDQHLALAMLVLVIRKKEGINQPFKTSE